MNQVAASVAAANHRERFAFAMKVVYGDTTRTEIASLLNKQCSLTLPFFTISTVNIIPSSSCSSRWQCITAFPWYLWALKRICQQLYWV